MNKKRSRRLRVLQNQAAGFGIKCTFDFKHKWPYPCYVFSIESASAAHYDFILENRGSIHGAVPLDLVLRNIESIILSLQDLATEPY